MCLLIASALMFGAYSFFTQGLQIQAVISAMVALILYAIFLYRMIINRKCIFGDKKDCNKK
ncbi:hypothetical protein [Sulfurimonas sp.]